MAAWYTSSYKRTFIKYVPFPENSNVSRESDIKKYVQEYTNKK